MMMTAADAINLAEIDAGGWGVVVIAHGSRRPEANQDLFDLVDRLRQSGLRQVHGAFLELAAPGIVEAGHQCVAAGAHRVILLPYFLAAGKHVTHDLETARRELEMFYPDRAFVLAGPLGPHPYLDAIVAERIKGAADPTSH